MSFDFSLLSYHFIALAFVAIGLLTVLKGPIRQWAFLSLNICFSWLLLLGLQGTLSSFFFCLTGYALIYLTINKPNLVYRLFIPGFVVLFVYMRNYELLYLILPESVLTNKLATIGLSFLLFKIIHILIEVASGTIRSVDFLSFINYCFNFTTFMMGPIQRFDDYCDQWQGKKQLVPLGFEAHLDAVIRIVVGFVKAYVLASWVMPFAMMPNTNIHELSYIELLTSIYAFYFFLYFNFSGYCDVMIGVGTLFGVRPPENFNKPFLARNISDFWQRQHRSLTLWLTDYVFSPIYKKYLTSDSMMAHPLIAINISLMITMIVSGFWHGTTLAFLLFGISHGIFLVVYHDWNIWLTHKIGRKRTKKLRQNLLVHGGGIFLTFNATAMAFVFFNLSWSDAFIVFARLLGA